MSRVLCTPAKHTDGQRTETANCRTRPKVEPRQNERLIHMYDKYTARMEAQRSACPWTTVTPASRVKHLCRLKVDGHHRSKAPDAGYTPVSSAARRSPRPDAEHLLKGTAGALICRQQETAGRWKRTGTGGA